MLLMNAADADEMGGVAEWDGRTAHQELLFVFKSVSIRQRYFPIGDEPFPRPKKKVRKGVYPLFRIQVHAFRVCAMHR
jgi:hypothetical protein